MQRVFPPVLVVCLIALLYSPVSAQPEVPEGVWVRDGYELTVALQMEQRTRFLEMGPDGTLYISLPNEGQVRAARDTNGDGYYNSVTVFVDGYPKAHGLEWHDGWLWFTQTGAVRRARDTNGDYKADEVEEPIKSGQIYSEGGGHWYRSICIHDGRLYTSIGDKGNITEPTEGRQVIHSFSLDGSDKQLFASGLRNTEKLVIRPGTDELWGMDHGSDWFGRPVGDRRGKQPITNYNPPGEMNHYRKGEFYGHPYIVGNKIPRYEYTDREDIIDLAARTVPPAWPTGAHWAPNAMCFYRGEQFPDHHGDAFVAFHGSWNREPRAGYQVARVMFEDGKPYGELPYVKFLTDSGDVLGRPVDVITANDGTLLFSDDRGKRVYRLRYIGEQ